MKFNALPVMLLSTAFVLSAPALADEPSQSIGSKLGSRLADQSREKARAEGNSKIAAKVNQRLLAEGRKHQCSFKSGSDELEKGCGAKSKKLAAAIIDVKKSLQSQGQSGFKFVVSGHTDSTGDAAKNKELSARRAQVIVKELISEGVDAKDIEAIGMGSDRMLVKPDDTPAKKAKNRRYEVQVRF